jgi:hypothetical protein
MTAWLAWIGALSTEQAGARAEQKHVGSQTFFRHRARKDIKTPTMQLGRTLDRQIIKDIFHLPYRLKEHTLFEVRK